MLVLRRKVGETIVMGDTVRVTVLAAEGERVKLGIEAPADVSIVREELLLPQTPAPPNHASTRRPQEG